MKYWKLIILFALPFFVTQTAFAETTLIWSTQTLSNTQLKGTFITHDLSFTSMDDLEKVEFRVIPSLKEWVTVTPSYFEHVEKGEENQFKVSINLPEEFKKNNLAGVIQLRHLINGKSQKTIAIPLQVNINITDNIEDILPPDPGADGEITLLGVDSDHDGVRDDIQRYIYINYYNNNRVRMTLIDRAKEFQNLFINADNKPAAYDIATRFGLHGECLYYLGGESTFEILTMLDSEILNTYERSKAYLKFNNYLAGEILTNNQISKWKFSCSFDVDTQG
ncbi:hypothetical protein AADZ86_15230 [Colwelliaceae bacterium BS250]